MSPIRWLSVFLLFFCTVPAQAQFTPLCRSGTTGTKNCSGPLNVTHAPTGIPAANIAAGTVTNGDFASLVGAAALGGTLADQLNAINTSITQLSVAATTLFLHNEVSNVAGYETLSTLPGNGVEISENVAASSGTGPVSFDKYLSDTGYPGVNKIPAGLWRFHDYAAVDSNTGVTRIRVQVSTRSTGGVETLHFITDGPELAVGTTEYLWTYTQPSDIAISATDRLVIEYFAISTSAASRTVTHYYEGTSRASHVDTPIVSPAAISGPANLVQATPNGSAGVVTLRPVESGDLAVSVTARMFPSPAAALANVTICGNGTSWGVVGAAPSGWLYAAGPTGCTWIKDLDASFYGITNLGTGSLAAGFNLPVNRGGTGKTSWTTGAVPVATAAATIGEIAPTAAGYVLTDNGVGSAATFQAPAASEIVTAKLASTYSVASTTYTNVGLSLPLTAGQWRIACDLRDLVQTSAGNGFLKLRLYNSTDAAVVTDSETAGTLSATTGAPYGGAVALTMDVTLAGSKTIDLQAARDPVATYTFAQMPSDAEGWCRCRAMRRSK